VHKRIDNTITRRSMKTVIKTVSAMAVSLVTLASLTACTDTADRDTGPAPGDTCASAQPKVEKDTPTVVILGQSGPDLTTTYQADIDLVTAAAKRAQSRVLINGVATADLVPPTLLTNVILDGEGNNMLERNANLDCKTDALQDAVDTLEQSAAAERPDAFDAITTLTGLLENNPSEQPVDVVLLTPLIAHAGGIDLADPDTLADPVTAINTLAKKGLMPASCDGYRVSPDSGLPPSQAAKLRDFWMLYADKCGGQLVNWSTHLAAFPATDTIPSADQSQLKVDTTPTTITASLSADVLFDPDSAVLHQRATPELNELLDLATAHGGPIVITGYVNPVNPGTNSAGDKALSRERADAVASWLVAERVRATRITTIGRGASDAVYPRPQNDEQRAANRRVVTIIRTTNA
jgi:outer membrane protein OmpA-like peptidoglycan-associated protein